MLVLPLIYVGLIALLGYIIYYHAVNHMGMMSLSGRGRLMVMMTALYLTPIVAGLILLIFLIKPLFARRPDERRVRLLGHEEAPLLFALIGELCRAMNAPIPSRVDIDCDINASASFRSGLGSLFGRDVKLTIGLPLVAGLTLQQFVGVLAHEFGHFTQGAAMRLTYLVRSINFWFARVVFERDEWDWWLIQQSEEAHSYAMLFFYTARFGVWCSRRVLWILMTVGQAISSFMLRQMEHDADAYERRVAGSESFIATVHALQRLNLAAYGSFPQLKKMWQRDHRLYDSLPEFINAQAREIPADTQGRLYEKYLARKTGLFDTHPSEHERIRRAEAANDPGIYHETAPATCLFKDFGQVSRNLTLEIYEDLVGDQLRDEFLIPIARISTDLAYDISADRTAVNEFFMGVASSLRPITLTKSSAFRDFATLERDLHSARNQMCALQPHAMEAIIAFKDAEASFLLARQAMALTDAGIPFNFSDFGLTNATPESLTQALKVAQSRMDEAGAGLKLFEDASLSRVTCGLQLIRSIQTAGRLEDADALFDEAKELRWILKHLVSAFGSVLQLRADASLVETLRTWSANSASLQTASHISEISQRIRHHLQLLQDKTSNVVFPFPHPAGRISLSEFAKCRDFHPDPAEMLVREANAHVQNLIGLYYRILARLITIVQKVETVVSGKGD